MLAKRNQVKLKRILSTLLAVVMLLGLLPMGALAETMEDKNQIEMTGGKTAYYAWDGEGFSETPGTQARTTNGATGSTPLVATEKTIAAVEGTENEFDITLKVETTQKIEETASSPDAAVVLLIDASASMEYCANCGHDSIHQSGWSDNKCFYCDCTNYETRFDAAKRAAKEFIKVYAGFSKQENGTYNFVDPNAAWWVCAVSYTHLTLPTT